MFHPSDHNPELYEEEFRLLRDFIHERFGLSFEDSQRSSLRTRLAGRLVALDLLSFEDYYHYLRFSPDREDELRRMASHVTNNETYFFREPSQLEVLGQTLLRELKDRKTRAGERQLRLLSAGCSSGEEALTLAMLVFDSGQFFWNWNVDVVGLDLDHDTLERARRGVYHRNSFRSMPPALMERHFGREGSGWRVKDGVRRMVQFRLGNILTPESYKGLEPLDVILCRNVLIYFSDATMLKVVRLFHSLLAPGGYLLLGHAESLARITDAFTPLRFPGALVYQRPVNDP